MKHLKPLIALVVAGFVVCGVWLLFISSTSRTVDFSGTVESVRVDEENGSVYVTAVQELSNFTCEIEIKKHTRCKDVDGAKIDPAELKAGDKILLNFRGKPQEVDGINKAVAKSTVKVFPTPTRGNQGYQEMTIKMLPSPPTIKTTQDSSVIEQIKNLIDGFDKEEIPNTQEAGWTILITFSNGKDYLHCSLTNDTLRYGEKAYRVDGERFASEITKIFETL